MTLVGQENVCRLEVAMHDAMRVSGGESVGDRCGNLRRFSPRQPFAPKPVGQRFAAQQFHHRERDTVLGSEVMNGQDIRMREGSDRFRLLLEAAKRFRIMGDALRDDLDGHLTAQARVACAIDLAHPTRAERRDDLVGTEAIAGSQTDTAIRMRSGIAQIVVPLAADSSASPPDPQALSQLSYGSTIGMGTAAYFSFLRMR